MRALSRFVAARGRLARRSNIPRAFFPALVSSADSRRGLATEAFMSRHYQMQDPRDVGDFLRRKSLAVRETDSHFVVRDCPFCHTTHGKADNLFKMYVHKTQGVYKCHRCGAAGSWFDFKRKLQGSVGVASAGSALYGGSSAGAPGFSAEVKVIQALDNEKAMAIQKNLLDDPEFESVLKYLTDVRGLSKEVLQKYCVGAIEQPFWDHESGERVNAKCISFPWMARQMDMGAMGVVCQDQQKPATEDKNLYDVVRLKIRAVEDKAKQQLVPKGGSWGLFGWNTVPTAANELVLTEGEFDAMAVHQATGIPAVSLPNGCQSLPPSVLPLLERFKRIYLWMDNDASGQSNVEKFASKLGMTRCYIVRMPANASSSPAKDANDALRAGLDLGAIVKSAERIPHSQITTFEELRRDVYEEIVNPLRACGVQSRAFPSLNRLMKGHRMGEVTVLTGPTGCGKTTLLSQLSLDLCGQGVSTLWGSFEIKNTRLMHKMLTQLAQRNLSGDVNAFEAAADQFEALPMYFLRFFGSTEVDEVLDAMEYAVYAYDVQHILLDNVQFMMAGQGRGFDKFERQDAALDKFRKFASAKNVHLTLVIHPRKEQEDQDLTLTSVFGTAKATQEADNVLILQRTRGESKLDIRKNRFDGTLGSIPLKFDPDSASLCEVGTEGMSEGVASVDLEAEMQLAQKRRMQSSSRAQERQQPEPTYNPFPDMEPEDAHPAHQYQYVAVNGHNGHNGSRSFKVNGSSLPRLDNENPDDHHSNGSSSGLNGSSSHSRPDAPGDLGPRAGGGSGEPFAAFTPIITR
ncbi:Twinkle protein [Phytophthora fragariae]|uniref:Twinkle protein n=2 Tax=Phytophthora fragariae TaxID=53985 RepID=A0A6A3F712_9STRA|nr:Twinkle protein [Phytophthora fragariae]KAE8941625.1 Twinkle protein [Phytophthora fragariae]KAE9017057.1 Twinkle protein [Phytophthora fragariae]KAE9115615.1 Twinkle protein [Phytophthora fragariae]KAE9119739.1 Twinkle protein [Phytophthora fragariae]